jgi:hypothetical protein
LIIDIILAFAVGILTVFLWLQSNEIRAINEYLEDQDYEIHIHAFKPDEEDEDKD